MKEQNLPEKLDNFPIEDTTSFDLGHKGYWFEQTAEFAERINERTERNTNYGKAFEAYLQGGWFNQALRIAKLIPDEGKVKRTLETFEKYDNLRREK